MCLDKTVRRRKETRSGRKLQSRLLLAQSNRLPRLLCPQALLLLGLNSISASLQDQHCESLSVATTTSKNLLARSTMVLPPARRRRMCHHCQRPGRGARGLVQICFWSCDL